MKQYNVPALEKALAILELLSNSDSGLTNTEIHAELDIPKATIFMILNVLVSHQVVQKRPSGHYTIGVKLYNLGSTYMTKMDIKKIARPYIEELAAETGFTCHLGILLDDGRVMYVDKVEHKTFIKFSTFEGLRSDIHVSSLGKAIAAYLPEDRLDEILREIGMGRYTPNTITTPELFKKVLVSIRENGYSLEDEEGEIGVRCIGAPIFNHEGKVTSAVSITALRSELLLDLIKSTGEKVIKAAQGISQQLGYSGDENSLYVFKGGKEESK